MTRLAILLTLILGLNAAALRAEKPEATLDAAIARITSAGSVNATCHISSGGASTAARLTMEGKKFHIAADGTAIWYDGTTQWTWMKRTGEVDITTPTPDELSQVNPLAVVGAFRQAYAVQSVKAPDGLKRLLLKAKNAGADISSITLTLNAKDLSPRALDLEYANGTTLSMTITSWVIGKPLPPSTFVYSKSLHPDAKIVDLR